MYQIGQQLRSPPAAARSLIGMINSDNLCMSCMKEIGQAKKCPHCGYYADSAQISPYLPVRTLIANRYLVGKMLEYNGEGATYMGWDITEKKAIKIREFIPDSFTIRSTSNLTLQVMRGSEAVFAELRRSFEEMWSKLARLKGLSALISVNDVVEDYGTSYAIYDHFEGISLRDFLLRSQTGYITWERARQLLMPLLSTIGTLHSVGIIHRGISPSTLVISTDGKIKITGFCIGAARTARSDINARLFDGYAAIEQYGFDGQQGTWTDIYAFAAVLYRTLIGSDPISAKERMANDRLMVPGKFAEALPAYVINGLINALQILPEDRTRTVEQLRAELSASPVATAVSGQYQRTNMPQVRPGAPVPPPAPVPNGAQVPKPQNNKSKKKKKKNSGAFSTMLITILICTIVGLIIFSVLMLTVWRDDVLGESPEGSVTTTASAEMYKVPNLMGQSYSSISQNPVYSERFRIELVEVYTDSNSDAGYVVNQSIEAGSDVPAGTVITVEVSLGVEMILLEDVTGFNIEEIEPRLTELGFKVDIEEVNEGNYDDGEIIRVGLTTGQKYPKGTSVKLQVYFTPPEPETDEYGEPATDEDGNIVYITEPEEETEE